MIIQEFPNPDKLLKYDVFNFVHLILAKNMKGVKKKILKF